jgi:hypothetical protein
MGFTKSIASEGVQDLLSKDFENLEGLILSQVQKTGYRSETL